MIPIRSKPTPSEDVPGSRVVLALRLAGVAAVASGLVGGYVWLLDLADRLDGDALRLGFWHNPFMRFPPFNKPFLDASMWVLLACSAAAGMGGVMLLVPLEWGAALVTWQARVSIVINGATAFFIVAGMSAFAENQWGEYYPAGSSTALALRLGSMAVDLSLWAFLGGNAVREFWRWRPHPSPARAFEVIATGNGSA